MRFCGLLRPDIVDYLINEQNSEQILTSVLANEAVDCTRFRILLQNCETCNLNIAVLGLILLFAATATTST